MAVAYDRAAVRHLRDAVLLQQEKRLPNADQLLGLATECALKVAVVRVRGSTAEGGVRGEFREHVDRLWNLVQVQSITGVFRQLAPVLRATTPFHDWRIEQRYFDDDCVTPEAVQRHLQATRRVCGALGILGLAEGI